MSSLSSGEGVVEALAVKYAVSFEAAQAIYSAGEAKALVRSAVRASESKTPHGSCAGDEHNSSETFSFSPGLTFEALRALQANFAHERDWDQFHTPRNLCLALVGEVGEVSECFQWKGEVAAGLPDFSSKERAHVGQELSDVLLYLLRLAEKCHIDLPAAALDKIELNAVKYPSGQVKGSSMKYNEY
jgi:dCTP diphosphatase